QQMGHRVLILNPYNVLHNYLEGKGERVINGARFNPLDRIDPLSANFVADVRSLTQALIVEQGGDSHWPNSARELVAALIMYVCITCTGNRRTLGHVRELLTQPLEGFIKTLVEMTTSDCAPIAQKAAQFSGGTNEIKSIISTTRTQLAFLDDPKICDCLSRSDFQFSDLKREKISVYLVLPFRQMEAQGRWLRLLVTSAVEALTDDPKPGDGRVLVILDEFAQLGRLTAIERALALVRGYGVQLWPFVQDLPQLKSIYPDRWNSFLATAGIQQFFTPNDNMTAEYMSDRCGKQLVRRTSFSESQSRSSSNSSTSTSYADQWEPLFSPWELYGQKDYKQMLFVEGLSPVAWEWRTKEYFKNTYYHGKFDPDPFHIR
ncbi:type IV secretory system conjugative DNA transfer family protein, partial [bacterium]|nr:type IV secretory system conjugative DNA transfer family protein [bacterium]